MKQKLLFGKRSELLSRIVFLFILFFTMGTSYAQTVTANTQSTNNGFFYSFWNDGSRGSASMTLGAAGNYSTTWSNIGNFTAGKGWAVGKADRTVCFSGSFNGGSNGFLALYGWTKNALIEYYVCENHGSWTPPGNTSDIQKKGTYTSDGGTYTIYVAQRTNAPSIEGNSSTFKQYWSVRTETRSSGTITFANHVAAWKAAGMNMGSTWDYQIMESEGYMSSGSSNITISECSTSTCATAAPTTIASFDYEVGATATQLTATGTALKWYADNTTTTTLSAAPTPSTATAGTTKYYVSQTLNGCEGPRAEITVRVTQKYKVYKVSAPIAIDGTIESSWTNASVLPAAATKLLTGTVTNSADLSGNFKALWDDTYLYVLGDITDDKLVNESTNVYDDDAIEVYVDINNDKAATYGANDVQYSFGWNDGATVGALPSGRSTTGITYSAVAKTGGYIVEARIPWTTLQGSPVIGQLVGMDFMVNDDDDGGTRDGKLAWNATTDDAWEDPSLFGTAILQGLLPCTTPAAPTVTSAITYCQNATATALTATGTSLLWYTNATTGTGSATIPIPATGSAGTVNYYVSQNVGGCESARAQIAVTVNALPTASITASAATTFCTGGSVTLTASAGTSYVWKNGSTQVGIAATYSATTAGSYTVEVTNAATCKATSAATTVTVNAAPIAPTVTATLAYCQNAAATALTATGTALKWYADNTTTTALANTPVPSTNTAGTTNYYVSQTTSGCESPRAQIAVTVNALPAATITASSATTFCAGGSVTLTASTGSSYVWKNGSTQVGTAATYSATAAGSYTVEVANATCKATSAATTVTVNAAPNAPTVTATVAYCQNAAATALTATGTSLKWYADNTTTTALANTPVPSTTAAGTTNYYVSQTTSGCESARTQIAVTVNALPAATITASAATTFCTGGSVTLTASTGSSYVWRNGSAQVGTTATYSATAAGSYTVEVTNAATCKATSSATVVTVNAALAAPAVTSPVVYCQNAAATALTANGTALKWYADNTTTTALATTPVPSTTAVGTTNYYVSQTNGCESTRALIAVTVNAAPAAPTVTSPVVYCQNATATALTANGTSLKWYADNTTTTALANTPVPSTTTAGSTNYYVSQTTSGCESTRAQIAVTVNALPTATIIASAATTFCTGGSVTLTASTGSSYIWKNGSDQVGTAATYSATTAGSYTVEVTSVNTCKATSAPTVVTVNTALAAPTVISPVVYCQNETATALTATGTALKWYDVETNGTALANTPVPSTATAGTTNYYVSQTNGCESARALIAVTVNALPTAAITVSGNTTIVDGETVALTTAAVAGVTYKWFNGSTEVGTGIAYTASAAGNYTVQATNTTTLCASTSAVTSIATTSNQPSVITITSIANNANLKAPVTIAATVTDPDGAIVLVEFLDGTTVIGSSKSAPYSFIWTNPSTGPHSISVRATDALGGVTTSAAITITTGVATAIQASHNNIYSNVYPIPATDELIVETELDLTGSLIRMTNALGQEVTLPILIEGTNAKLNVSQLAKGTYILTITQNSSILTKKIVVAN